METLTYRQRLSQLKEPYSSQAIKNFFKRRGDEIDEPATREDLDDILDMFNWSASEQGHDYWSVIVHHIRNNGPDDYLRSDACLPEFSILPQSEEEVTQLAKNIADVFGFTGKAKVRVDFVSCTINKNDRFIARAYDHGNDHLCFPKIRYTRPDSTLKNRRGMITMHGGMRVIFTPINIPKKENELLKEHQDRYEEYIENK